MPEIDNAGRTTSADEQAEKRTEETHSFMRSVRRATRRKYTPEEKIRIVLEGFRREATFNDLCRREGINPANYYSWTKEFMEAGKERLTRNTVRDATRAEIEQPKRENGDLKEIVADLLLETHRLKKTAIPPLGHGTAGHLDETYIKVGGRWRYLYRAIDRDGNLLDSSHSEHRDKHAARRFLRRLLDSAGQKPLRLTTPKHPAYRKAIRWIIGRKVLHRQNQYLNNRIEQSHRPLKQRYYPMLDFRNFESASRFCTAFDELRNYLRIRSVDDMPIAGSRRREIFTGRWSALMTELAE